MVAIANSCDVTILAEGLETEEQWQALIDLGLQGGQGYWLGKPSADHIIGWLYWVAMPLDRASSGSSESL